ncbi:hypothetical protein D3C76_359170 [compost metagenome]
MIRHRLLSGQGLLQAARLQCRRLGLSQGALALEQLLFQLAAMGRASPQTLGKGLGREGGQLPMMLPIARQLGLLLGQRPLTLGQPGAGLGQGIIQALQGGTASPELIRRDGQQSTQIIFGDAEGAGMGCPATQRLATTTTAHLPVLLEMGQPGLELGLLLPGDPQRRHRLLELAGRQLQPLLPLLLDQGDGSAFEAGLPASEQPLTLLLRLLVVALQLVQQLVLALQPRLLGAQGRGQSGQLAAQLLPLTLSTQIRFAGLLPLLPLPAAKPLAPGLGPHLFIEAGLPQCQALAQ